VPATAHKSFRCQPLADLTRQLLIAPADRRAIMVRRTESLHDDIEADRTYPFDFVVFRITGFHAEENGETLLVGEAMLPDLRQMIDQLSKSVAMAANEDEDIDTIDDLADRLSVSTKTIRRWRDKGLRWRWTLFPGDKHKKVGISQAAVDHFLKSNEELVSYASRFQHIADDDRQRIIRRARRIAGAADVSLNTVAQHLAKKYGRALETVRQILELHDQRNPDDRIFIDRTGPLTVKQRRLIARAHRMGVPASKLAQRFHRTRSTIYRAIHRRQAAALRRRPIAFTKSPTFDRDDADEVILQQRTLEDITQTVSAAPIGDLPEPIRPLFRQPTLPNPDQQRLAVQMNYLKFRAATVRDSLDRVEPRSTDIRFVEDALADADAIRKTLIQVNLPTVLTVARQHMTDMPVESQKTALLLELLEAGVALLFDGIDSFDPFRGRTLNRHLNWTMARHFAKSVAADPTMAVWARKASSRAQRRDQAVDVASRIRDLLAKQGVRLDDAT